MIGLAFRAGGGTRVEGMQPVGWGPQQGIAWQCELPGYGQSTPVIFEDRVFVFLETGNVVAISLQDAQLWHCVLTTDYGKFDNNHDAPGDCPFF